MIGFYYYGIFSFGKNWNGNTWRDLKELLDRIYNKITKIIIYYDLYPVYKRILFNKDREKHTQSKFLKVGD